MSEAWDLTRLLERELGTAAEQVHVAGALRRGEESVSCLDFVLRPSVDAGLRRLAGLRQVLRVDVAKQSAQSSAGIRIQLHEARADLGNALVLATGNAAHVEALSARAAQRGFSLASSAAARGASSDGRTPPVREFPTEAELYRGLGLSWVPPELRQGHGELEQAEKSGFEQLLTLADVRGMIHCHTTYSDGQHSVLDMARAAYALGMQYIAITDHSPTAHYAKGVALDRLHRQWDEIAAAQEQVPIRILRGTESDILANGQLDYPDDVLEQLEVVIASIHARYRATRTAMTERLIRALSLPIFKIWGHPLGRIIGHRDAIECDLPAVLDALAQSPGAVEINADPHRLDLPSSLIPAVRARGIPFILSADAHSTSGFGVLRFGVSTARRGGVNRSEVLNTLPCETFAARVQPVAKATTS
jgi:DNA polymerase (family 10)